MFPKFLLIIALVVATLTGGVAAQADNTTVEVPINDEPETCDLYVTESISLCSAEFDQGHAVLVFNSSERQRVTVTEAVALDEYREINRESFVLDGKTEVRLPVDSQGGAAGVTVDDGTILYGIPIKTSSSIFGGPWGPSDSQAAGLGAGLAVALLTLTMVFRARGGKDEEPERIA